MADKTITFSKTIVAQKPITPDGTLCITQLSKPIILKGISTKTCKTILYSIDGINFTDEATIGNSNVLSMAIVPFQLGGPEIDSPANEQFHKDQLIYAFKYILAGRYVNEDINIDKPISQISQAEDPDSANGAYRYLLQYLADHEVPWDTGDLFTTLNADRQDSFGGSDFISEGISVGYADTHLLHIEHEGDGITNILKPAIVLPMDDYMSTNIIRIISYPDFFLSPEGCPASESPEKLIIDNFWRGGGLLVSHYNSDRTKGILMLYIFAVT